MTYFPVQSPYNLFSDTDGEPLESGYIYIGEAYQNPITKPITITWDTAGLYPAAQPVRTIGGYPDRNGSPAKIYINLSNHADYSILINDKNGKQVFYSQSYIAEYNGNISANVDFISDLRAIPSAIYPVYVRGHTTIADGGDGIFEWVDGAAPATYTDDDGITIVPTGGDGSGAWIRSYTGVIYFDWYGPDKTGVISCSTKLTAAISAGDVKITAGTYSCGDIQVNQRRVFGEGKNSILKAESGATTVFYLGYAGYWNWTEIKNLTVDGNSKSSNGFTFGQRADGLDGRWIIDNIYFQNCDICIYKPQGNIGNRISNCTFFICNYGIFAKGQTSPIMHSGNDLIVGNHFGHSIALCGYYCDANNVSGTGQIILNQNIFEGNFGASILIKNSIFPYSNFVFDGNWMEANTQDAAITLDGIAYDSADYIFDNARATIKNGYIKSYRLFNESYVTLRDCRIDNLTGYYYSEVDSDCIIDSTNQLSRYLIYDGNIKTLKIAPTDYDNGGTNSRNSLYNMPHCGSEIYHYGNYLSLPMNGTTPYTWGGSVSINSVQVNEGNIYQEAAQFTILASNIHIHSAFTLTVGKYMVFTCSYRTTGTAYIFAGYDQSRFISTPDGSDEWITNKGFHFNTAAGVARVAIYGGASGGDVFIREIQFIEFNTKAEAIDYINSGKFVI